MWKPYVAKYAHAKRDERTNGLTLEVDALFRHRHATPCSYRVIPLPVFMEIGDRDVDVEARRCSKVHGVPGAHTREKE